MATAFQTATGTFQGELMACQRYYWRENATVGGYTALAMGNSDSTSQIQALVKCPVTMRVTPTALDTSAMSTFYWFTGATNGNTPTSVTLSALSTNEIPTVIVAKSASFVAGSNYVVLSNSGGGAYLGFSAEL